jgi:hypothetical protein
MQQKLIDGLMQGLLDPRFQSLITEFYAVRQTLTIADEDRLGTCIRDLLTTICSVLEDQHSLQEMKQAMGGTATSCDIQEALCCVREAEGFISGPVFPDVITVLFILCSKLGLDEKGTSSLQATEVIQRLDDFLSLIGLHEVSILQLWDNAIDELANQRVQLFGAVMSVVQVVQQECVLSS